MQGYCHTRFGFVRPVRYDSTLCTCEHNNRGEVGRAAEAEPSERLGRASCAKVEQPHGRVFNQQ